MFNNSKPNRVIPIFWILCCFSLALQAQMQLPESAKQHQHVKSGETPQGLTTNEWRNIQQQINAAKYRAHADAKGGYLASNSAHGWQIQYAVDGTTTLTPRNNQAKPYHLKMKLSAIGYQTLQTLHKPQTVSQQNFTVSYQWNDDLRERWINSEQQLEQWFDIARRPDGAEKGQPLTVQMTLDSKLKITQNGNSIQFTNSKGTDISYNKLKVWDSTGKELPAHMQLENKKLSLLVDDSTAHYPLTIDPSFQQQAYIKASNTDARDYFGHSIAISGNTLVVGAYGEDSNSTGINGEQSDNSAESAGAVYVFIRTGTVWAQQAYLKASNTGADDQFGISVAISGDTLVVGAENEDSISTGVNGDHNDNSTENAGAAYVFNRSGTTWTQQAYLKASNSNAGDLFGGAVAIFGDTVVVGADREDSSTGLNGDQSDNSAEDAGAVYIFTRSNALWTQQTYLKASNSNAEDQFGGAVSIDGNTLVVGAVGAEPTGVAYVFINSGTTWIQQADLMPSIPSGLFGYSVAISGDTLVVGAPGDDFNDLGKFVAPGPGDPSRASSSNSGAAYVFNRLGSTWTQHTRFNFSGYRHQLGISVAISGDTILVGAVLAEFRDSRGEVYVYTRIGSVWVGGISLTSLSHPDFYDLFGNSVAISGSTLAVGSPWEDYNSTGVNNHQTDRSAYQSGAAYVYEKETIPGNIETLLIPIQTGADDAEENILDGDVSLFSSDLELVLDGTKQQLVGLRFPVEIPAGATILNAYIQFTADETNGDYVNNVLSLSGEATGDALPFSDLKYNISDRPLTEATVLWSPGLWRQKGSAGEAEATPDLSDIVQQIVSQIDWVQGNHMAFIISSDRDGVGTAEAESFDGTAPPVLHVEFSTAPLVPEAPVAVDDGTALATAYTTGVDQQLIVPNDADDVVERNDNTGFPIAEVSSFDASSVEGGVVSVAPDGSFSYTPAAGFMGVDNFSYTLENTEGSDSATVYISVIDLTSLWIPVNIGSDDAEEDISNGNMRLTSSDLELTRDDDLAINQQVGVRFQNLAIPAGATIIDAYIQYTADERNAEPTVLTINGEASANALTFNDALFDISGRILTVAQIQWTPEAWNTGEKSSRTQTPDLSAIVQEIVNQDEWLEDNSIAFITNGNGKRVAESFNGTAAPVLHVSFSMNEVFYVLGDTGPGGGIVFYTTNGGVNGLEVALENEGQAVWGCYATTRPPAIITGADGTAVGTGMQNTVDILAACNEPGIAAEIADQYQLNAISDWFLPSTDEALLMYQQRDLIGLSANFWTSTENSAYSSFYLRLSQGDTRTGNKEVFFDVWPIRAF